MQSLQNSKPSSPNPRNRSSSNPPKPSSSATLPMSSNQTDNSLGVEANAHVSEGEDDEV